MLIQKINNFKSQNPHVVIPEWFSDMPSFDWVFIWDENRKTNMTWRCEQMGQDWIIIKDIINETSLSCTNLLENWDCWKSWDWREWFSECKINKVVKELLVSS